MAKRKRSGAEAGTRAAAGSGARSSEHYEGKQHYPRVLYAKTKDGIVQRRVEDAEEHRALAKEDPALTWESSPAAHGVETAPAAEPVAREKIGGQS